MDVYFKVKSKRTKFILSFISSIVYLLGYSIIMESGNFSVYFISYIHYKQEWVDMQFGNLMRPIIVLFLSVFSPLSGIMENLVGPRLALLSSAIVIEIALIFFFLQRNLWIFYILSLILGLGCGLSAQIVVKNCCLYYPKKKGFISACIMSLGALIGSSYTLLGEKIINPDREEVIDKKENPYYNEDISERSKYFFLFGMLIMPIATALSIFLFYKYDPNCETENEAEDKVESKVDDIKGPLLESTKEEEIKKIENIAPSSDEKEGEKVNIQNSFNKSTLQQNTKKALKTFRFWRNILISGVMPFGVLFIFATSRAYSSLLGVSGDIVGTLAGTMNIIGSTCNPIWAFCCDKFGFQPVTKIITIFIIVSNCYFFIFLDWDYFYVAGLYISCIFRGGVLACITPHVMQIYGLKYYLLLGGFLRLFNALFNFMIAMISTIISIWCHSSSALLLPYRIICVIGAILAIIGLVFVFQENDSKFRFDDENEEEAKEKNIIKEKDEKISEEETPKKEKEKNEENKDNEEIKVENHEEKPKEDSKEELGEKNEEDKNNEEIKVENVEYKPKEDCKEIVEEKGGYKKETEEIKDEHEEYKSKENFKEKEEDKSKDKKENKKESIDVNLNNEENGNINK